MIGIYKIENLINHHIYIGQSVDINKRLTTHKRVAFNENSDEYDYPLYKAIRKYGIDNFSFEVVEECLKSELNEKEIYWIKYYNSFFNGYNQTFGGDNTRHQIPKESIKGIINDLETTDLIQKDIANKWNISEEMVQGINTGRYWHYDREYPIRKLKLKYPEHNYCIDCGKEIFRTSIRCVKCENERRKQLNILPITREELKKLIRTKSFLSIGAQYGVSDNAIRKWCDKYNLPRKKADIKSISDIEWDKI